MKARDAFVYDPIGTLVRNFDLLRIATLKWTAGDWQSNCSMTNNVKCVDLQVCDWRCGKVTAVDKSSQEVTAEPWPDRGIHPLHTAHPFHHLDQEVCRLCFCSVVKLQPNAKHQLWSLLQLSYPLLGKKANGWNASAPILIDWFDLTHPFVFEKGTHPAQWKHWPRGTV